MASTRNGRNGVPIVQLAAVLAALALLAGACGTEADEAAAPDEPTAPEEEVPEGEPEEAPEEPPAEEPDGDTIRVGYVLDLTGPINIYGEPKEKVVELAIEQLNAEGGILGRPVELVMYDAQSTNELYTQYANQLALQDEVDVIMGGITSASREAVRPVINRHEMLYFYNEQYEGGVCDKNVFATGVVPSQQLAALIPWAIDNVGPRMVVLAADYNYGWISADWVEQYATEHGGEVLDTEFFPLDVTEFGPAISSLQADEPDVVVSLLVGGNHISFYRQFAAAGLQDQMRIVSPTFGLGNEQVVLSAEESRDITVAFPYFQELDTPANQEFLELFHAEFGADYPYVPDAALDEWLGLYVWAMAVEQAGTTERTAVIEALESGLSYEGPGGTVAMDGSSHHLVKDVHIGVANDEHGFDIIESFSQVSPSYEQDVCDLIANPDTSEQFTPIPVDE